MCRYGYKTYKAHFACFACRKAFKKTAITDYVQHKGLHEAWTRITHVYLDPDRRPKMEEKFGITYEQIVERYLKDVSVCPECAGPMAAMGLDFKPPAKADEEAWHIISVLYEHGFAFKGCGCHAVGYTPPALRRELPEWLKQHSRRSEREKLLNELGWRRT